MKANQIKVNEDHVVRIPGAGKNTRWYNRRPETFLPSQVIARVVAKGVKRPDGERNDGVRIQVSQEDFDRIPERFRAQMSPGNGVQRVWVVHSRSVIQNAAEVKMNQAQDEAIAEDKKRAAAGAIRIHDIGAIIQAQENTTGRAARDAVTYLRELQNRLEGQIEAIENGTNNEGFIPTVDDDGEWPTGEYYFSRALDRASTAFTKFEREAERSNEWREMRKGD